MNRLPFDDDTSHNDFDASPVEPSEPVSIGFGTVLLLVLLGSAILAVLCAGQGAFPGLFGEGGK